MTMVASRLLVIDDDLNTLTTFGRLLTIEGYKVTIAGTGREGLELLRSADFDLVLTDLRMPDLSGLEVLAEARVQVPHVPVLVFTAWGSRASEFAARHLGAVDFWDHPWDQTAFIAVIAKHASKVCPPEGRSTLHGGAGGPATRRWVSVVVAASLMSQDTPTVAEWAQELGKSVATLKRWCAMCDVHASDSLDFSRALRVVLTQQGHRCDWYNTLEIAEPRTMSAFLAKAGFSREGEIPDVQTFLLGQRFITNPELWKAVSQAIPLR